VHGSSSNRVCKAETTGCNIFKNVLDRPKAMRDLKTMSFLKGMQLNLRVMGAKAGLRLYDIGRERRITSWTEDSESCWMSTMPTAPTRSLRGQADRERSKKYIMIKILESILDLFIREF